jgi:hypothetical protein
METRQILEMMKDMQEKADAHRKADQSNAKANQKDLLVRMEAKMDAN